MSPMSVDPTGNFDAIRGWYRARDFGTQATLPSCEYFDAQPALRV